MPSEFKRINDIHDRWMRRLYTNTTATARLFAYTPSAETRDEFASLAGSAVERLRNLRDGFVQDWFDWMDYAQELDGANTMTKLVERECNIFGQAAQLLGAQATALAEWQENIAVDYAYWLFAKLQDSDKPE